MSGDARPGSWFPGWRHLGYAAGLSLAVFAVFGTVYVGFDYLTQWRTLRPIHFEIELDIPLVPAMTLAYVSLYGMFLLAPFVLQRKRELRALAAALVAAILMAGVGFLIWPAESAYPPPDNLGIWAELFHAADRINLRYNMAPSLHVALGVATAAILARHCAAPAAAMLWSWAALVSLSTVLTHQHHLIDVLTGAALGVAVDRIVYCRMAPPHGDKETGVMRPTEPQSAAAAIVRPAAPAPLANPAQDRISPA